MKDIVDLNFERTQRAEGLSWCIKDPVVRQDKAMREAVRYPLLKRQMGLEHLDTSRMIVWDIGAGPLGGVSTVVRAREVQRFEPLASEYQSYYPLTNYEATKGEDLKERLKRPDLIIVTNAMDHFDDPAEFLDDLGHYMKPGAFFAHLHAENNAITHPHEAHAHNLNPEVFRQHLDKDFETCWYLDNKRDGLVYGWRKQPAFSGLYRKVTGYRDGQGTDHSS